MLFSKTPNRFALPMIACGCVALAGCQGESKQPASDGPMIDIKTPIGDVKVDKDPDTGRANVDVDAGGVKVDVGSNE